MNKIKDIKNGDNVLTANPVTLEEEPSDMDRWFERMPDKVLEIKTISGRSLKCDPQHPFLISTDKHTYEYVKAGDLKKGDKVIVKNYVRQLSTDGKALVIKSSDINNRYIPELTKLDLLDRPLSDEKMCALARFVGALWSDGGVYKIKSSKSKCYTASFNLGEKEDGDDINDDLLLIGFEKVSIKECNTKHTNKETNKEKSDSVVRFD